MPATMSATSAPHLPATRTGSAAAPVDRGDAQRVVRCRPPAGRRSPCRARAVGHLAIAEQRRAGAAIGLADPVARVAGVGVPAVAVVGVLDGGDEVAPGSTAPSRSGWLVMPVSRDGDHGRGRAGAGLPGRLHARTPRRRSSMSLALLPPAGNSHRCPLLDTLAANSGSCGTAGGARARWAPPTRPRAIRPGAARGAAPPRARGGRRNPGGARGPGGATARSTPARSAIDRDAPGGRARPRRRRRAA